MLTQRFKILVGSVAAIAVAGGLAVNQYQQQVELNSVANRPAMQVVHEVVVTAAPSPTATPSAYLRVYKPYTPIKVVK